MCLIFSSDFTITVETVMNDNGVIHVIYGGHRFVHHHTNVEYGVSRWICAKRVNSTPCGYEIFTKDGMAFIPPDQFHHDPPQSYAMTYQEEDLAMDCASIVSSVYGESPAGGSDQRCDDGEQKNYGQKTADISMEEDDQIFEQEVSARRPRGVKPNYTNADFKVEAKIERSKEDVFYLLHDGHRYTQKGLNDDGTIRWYCQKKQKFSGKRCYVPAYTKTIGGVDMAHFPTGKIHNHVNNASSFQLNNKLLMSISLSSFYAG